MLPLSDKIMHSLPFKIHSLIRLALGIKCLRVLDWGSKLFGVSVCGSGGSSLSDLGDVQGRGLWAFSLEGPGWWLVVIPTEKTGMYDNGDSLFSYVESF